MGVVCLLKRWSIKYGNNLYKWYVICWLRFLDGMRVGDDGEDNRGTLNTLIRNGDNKLIYVICFM